MPKVMVYKHGNLVDQVDDFGTSFYIVEVPNTNILLWRAPGNPKWRTKEGDAPDEILLKPWSPLVWIVGTVKTYRIELLLEDWKLQVDDRDCAEGFYQLLELIWSKTSLSHGEYRFDFFLSPEERDFPTREETLKLPEPIYQRRPPEAGDGMI